MADRTLIKNTKPQIEKMVVACGVDPATDEAVPMSAITNVTELMSIVNQPGFLLLAGLRQIPGVSIIDKFGENPLIDTGTDPEDIWEAGGLYNYDANGTAPIVSIISDNAADTGFDIVVEGLDVDGELVSQAVTLNGTTRVALTTPLWRVFRMENDGDTGQDLTGTVYCYIGTGGVPVLADTRAIMSNGNNQTLMALRTIQKGVVGLLLKGELSMSRNQTTGAARCAYYSRRFGKVFKIKKRVDITAQGSGVYQDERTIPDIVPDLTDIRLTVEEVSANGTGVTGTFQMLLFDNSFFTDEFLAAIGQSGY